MLGDRVESCHLISSEICYFDLQLLVPEMLLKSVQTSPSHEKIKRDSNCERLKDLISWSPINASSGTSPKFTDERFRD